MKLTAGQVAALQWLSAHPATVMRETAGYHFLSQCFWKDCAPATIQSFQSLVRKGMADVKDHCFYYITDDGREALNQFSKPKTKGEQ